MNRKRLAILVGKETTPEGGDVRPRVEWTGNEQVSEMLDVSTAACTNCGGPARVPEDVAAVFQLGKVRTPVVVCEPCCDTMSATDLLGLIARVTKGSGDV